MNLLDQILDAADALTEPRMHREPLTRHDHNRNKKTVGWHTTTQPGLLRQLEDAITPTGTLTEGALGGSFASRPPLAVEALSRYETIRAGVHRWCYQLNIRVRKTVESNIRALVAATPMLDDQDARELLANLRQWRRWAAVLTGWEQLYQPSGVPCPVPDCSEVNTLRINLTSKTGMCRVCGAAWGEDDGSIQILAQYIKTVTEEVA